MIDFREVDWLTDEASEFARYWRSLPAKEGVPRQADFNPADIRHLLPGIAIYELSNDEEVICRLMGTALVDKIGRDYTDQNLQGLWGPEELEKLLKTFRKMLREPCGMIGKTLGHTESGIVFGSISVGFPATNRDGIRNRLIFQTNNFEPTKARIAREDQVSKVQVDSEIFISLA
ncbi:MAG: PAS domain-containing protein [Sneathiellales bacterium]|nr:PAS domain-containing protein [Sneathiellales bacterium]